MAEDEKPPAYQEISKANDHLEETDFASIDLFHVEVRSGEYFRSFNVDLGQTREEGPKFIHSNINRNIANCVITKDCQLTIPSLEP